MISFNVVASTSEDTVVSTYEPSKVRSDSYQSEAELEKEFIRLLCEQGYTYLPLCRAFCVERDGVICYNQRNGTGGAMRTNANFIT